MFGFLKFYFWIGNFLANQNRWIKCAWINAEMSSTSAEWKSLASYLKSTWDETIFLCMPSSFSSLLKGRMLRIFTKTELLFYSKSFSENIKAAINWAWGSSQHGLIWVHPSVHLNTNSLFLPNLCLKRDQEDSLKPRGIVSITPKLWLEFTVGKARVGMNIIKKKCSGKIHGTLVYMWLKEALKSLVEEFTGS